MLAIFFSLHPSSFSALTLLLRSPHQQLRLTRSVRAEGSAVWWTARRIARNTAPRTVRRTARQAVRRTTRKTALPEPRKIPRRSQTSRRLQGTTPRWIIRRSLKTGSPTPDAAEGLTERSPAPQWLCLATAILRHNEAHGVSLRFLSARLRYCLKRPVGPIRAGLTAGAATRASIKGICPVSVDDLRHRLA
jgi:hypothetical protein